MRTHSIALFFWFASAGVAQDQATTLAQLVDRARAIAVVRSLRVDSPDPEHLRVTFAVETTLRGTPPAHFELLEPRSRGCGRALHGVVPGQRFVACLEQRDDRWSLCAGGSRALPLAHAALVEHVQALAIADAQSRRNLLFAALSTDDQRVRDDAALSLAWLGDLAAADAAQRGALLDALRRAPNDALLQAAARLQLAPALDLILPAYLAGSDPQRTRLHAALLLQFDAGALAGRIAAQLDDCDDTMQLRAVQLLSQVGHDAAKAPLLNLLGRARERGVQLQACVGLLRLGVDRQQLTATSDADLVQLAAAALESRPRFRSIRVE